VTDRENAAGALGRELQEGLRREAERGLATAADPDMTQGVRRFLSTRKRPGG
jgi:hypothetical protein